MTHSHHLLMIRQQSPWWSRKFLPCVKSHSSLPCSQEHAKAESLCTWRIVPFAVNNCQSPIQPKAGGYPFSAVRLHVSSNRNQWTDEEFMYIWKLRADEILETVMKGKVVPVLNYLSGGTDPRLLSRKSLLYQLHRSFIQISSLNLDSLRRQNYWGSSACFDVTDGLLNTCCAFVRCWSRITKNFCIRFSWEGGVGQCFLLISYTHETS
jgi:hypothetical protein